MRVFIFIIIVAGSLGCSVGAGIANGYLAVEVFTNRPAPTPTVKSE